MPLVRVENVVYDLMAQSRPMRQETSQVAIIDVDERALELLGQWPWPRYLVARLVTAMRDARPGSIGIDFLFPEPDRVSLDQLRDAYQRDLGISLHFDEVPPDYRDNDLLLAEAVASPEVVMGAWGVFERVRAPGVGGLPQTEIIIQREPNALEPVPVPHAHGLISPVEAIARNTKTVGLVNSLADTDGTVRRMPLVVEVGGRLWPSLSLAAVMRALGYSQVHMKVNAAGVESVRIGDITIPTDRHGCMLLSFAGRDSAIGRISAADLLRAGSTTSDLRGKIVFLGSSAAALGDSHATPVDPALPGVQLHAVAADTIVRRDFVHAPPWTPGAQAGAVLLAGIGLALALSRLSVTVSAVLCGAGLLSFWWGAGWFLQAHGLYLSPLPGSLTLIVQFLALTLVRWRMEERLGAQRAEELVVAQDCAIVGLVSVAETRDPETGRHIIRTQQYVKTLAEQLSTHSRFRRELTPENIETIFKSAPLHDIGKVGVPDEILLKPQKLTDAEFDVMKGHTTLGHATLCRAEETAGLDQRHSFLHYAQEIAFGHHEKWDGSGYPQGIAGEKIPISARLMAVADVYDALRCKRPYKSPMPHERAAAIIIEGKGTHFDPDVVDAFLECQDTFQSIAASLADADERGSEDHKAASQV